MRSSKRIIDIHVAIGRQFFREHFLGSFVFGGFFLVEAGVFEHHDSSGGKSVDLRFLAETGIGEFDFLAQLAFKVRGDGSHAVLAGDVFVKIEGLSVLLGFFPGFLCVLVRIAEVAHQHKRCWILLQDVLDGRKSRHNAGIVLNHALFHRHIKINAHNNALAFQVNVFYCLNHEILLELIREFKLPDAAKNAQIRLNIYKNIAI
ncbi:MAG: hypothetical protein BWY39_01601 [Spirochaetes bacterium ADurb.Bin269]|nr:MAG: hypothetical protein BWY39_01601 [Spirochaetes bacterium ADurb.Bin269]